MKYMVPRVRIVKILSSCALLSLLIASCGGDDWTPVYFPPSEAAREKPVLPSASTGRNCTVTYAPRLCVMIKGDNIEAGLNEDSKLCGEVPPFPIHIKGAVVTINGSEFPDIDFEGGGLPAPIVINARGDGDGAGNVGTGSIDEAGNITIDNFSFYIVALGIVGEVPGLSFTTGQTKELLHLEPIEGSAPDSSGAMTLVAGTVLGSIIPAADKYLMGASMQAMFSGAITPPLSQCGGEEESPVRIVKIVSGKSGSQTEIPLPEGVKMEVSSGTYISEGDFDVGARFEATAKFKVTNISSRPISIAIPPQKGPFYITSVQPLSQVLASNSSIIISVAFRPTSENARPGVVSETLPLAGAQGVLTAVALSKAGSGSIATVDEDGNLLMPAVDSVLIGDQSLPANTQKDFFRCEQIDCAGATAFTNCVPCKDPTTEPCELVAISTDHAPLGEVDAKCKLKAEDATALLTIDLKGTSSVQISAKKQVLAIRNEGTGDMTITSITVEDPEESLSRGEFSIPPGAIFLAKSFDSIRSAVAIALEGGASQGTNLPVKLTPFKPGFDETSLYVVVTYEPLDLSGFAGDSAGVGSRAKDKALIRVTTSGGDITTEVAGTTTIRQSPALELYFKTPVGARQVGENQSFPFRGITMDTTDLAIPMFLRASDTSPSAIRVTSVSISGDDADSFQWLDSKEKIEAVSPETGKGLRCSIPVMDESGSQMIDEIFDLKPVSLGASGFDLLPGASTLETMPLFGCVNFHRDLAVALKQRIFKATLIVTSQELTAAGVPARNSDGSFRETKLPIELQAALDPIRGKVVFRVTQTMAAMLNPKFPGLSAIDARRDIEQELKSGLFKEEDMQVFTGALILDPFDEMTIKSSDGKETMTTPNDGVTAVFRSIDTHPTETNFEDKLLYDYASLTFDAALPEGSRGLYEDFPNVPAGAKANGWRIFTATLSYPGPIVPVGLSSPRQPSMCDIINPCDPQELRKFTKEGLTPSDKGACAFFYASGARYDSPAFHTAEDFEGGEFDNLCKSVGKDQKLIDVNTGRYSVDGELSFEEAGLRFFGPTYFHNPGGPLGAKDAMDTIFHLAFTTGTLKPQSNPDEPDVLPDKRINVSKGEFKINLDDPRQSSPPICKNNTGNRIVNGKKTGSWKFLKGLLFKDEDGTVPAGCPEEDNDFTGGSAYLRGRALDHETGKITVVTAGKFNSSEDLTFAFKDVMTFLVLNGWICDPLASEDAFEGSHCYDTSFNDRDAESQISLLD